MRGNRVGSMAEKCLYHPQAIEKEHNSRHIKSAFLSFQMEKCIKKSRLEAIQQLLPKTAKYHGHSCCRGYFGERPKRGCGGEWTGSCCSLFLYRDLKYDMANYKSALLFCADGPHLLDVFSDALYVIQASSHCFETTEVGRTKKFVGDCSSSCQRERSLSTHFRTRRERELNYGLIKAESDIIRIWNYQTVDSLVFLLLILFYIDIYTVQK